MSVIKVLHDYTKDTWPGLISPNLLDEDSSTLENGPGIWIGDGTTFTPGGGNLGISTNFLGRVTGNAHSGSYSIALTNPGDDPYPYISSNLVPITAGKLYYLVCYARTRGGTAAGISINGEMYNGDIFPALMSVEGMNYEIDVHDFEWQRMEFVFFVDYGIRYPLVSGETFRGPPVAVSFTIESLTTGLPSGCVLDFDDFALYETKYRPAGIDSGEGTDLQEWDGFEEFQIGYENFSTFGPKQDKLITSQGFSNPVVCVLDLKTNQYDSLYGSLPDGRYNTFIPEGSQVYGGITLSSRDGNGYFVQSATTTVTTPFPPFGYVRAQNYTDVPIYKIDVNGTRSLLAVWRCVAPGQAPFLGNIPYTTGPSSIAWDAAVQTTGGSQGPPGDDAIYIAYIGNFRVDLLGAFNPIYLITNGVIRVEQDGTITDLPELFQAQYFIDGHTVFLDESYFGCVASVNPAGEGPTVVTVQLAKFQGNFLNNFRPNYLKAAEVGSGVPARIVATTPVGTSSICIAPDWNRRDVISALSYTHNDYEHPGWITRYVWGDTFSEGIVQTEVIAGRIEDGVSPPIHSGPVHELLPVMQAVQALSSNRYAFAVRDDSSGGLGINTNPPLMQIWGRGVSQVVAHEQRQQFLVPTLRVPTGQAPISPFTGAPFEPGSETLSGVDVTAHTQRLHEARRPSP